MKFPFFGEKYSKPKFSDKEMQLSAPASKAEKKPAIFKPEIKEVGEFSPERKKFTIELARDLYDKAEFLRDRVTNYEDWVSPVNEAFSAVTRIAAKEKDFDLAKAYFQEEVYGLGSKFSLYSQRARLAMIEAGYEKYFEDIEKELEELSRIGNGANWSAPIFAEIGEFFWMEKYFGKAMMEAGKIENTQQRILVYSFIASKGNRKVIDDVLPIINTQLSGGMSPFILEPEKVSDDDMGISLTNIIIGLVKLGELKKAEEYLGKIKDPLIKINGMAEIGKLAPGYLSGSLVLAKDQLERVGRGIKGPPYGFVSKLASCFIRICESAGQEKRAVFFDSLNLALDTLNKIDYPEEYAVVYSKLALMLASHKIEISDGDLKTIKDLMAEKLKNKIFQKPKKEISDERTRPEDKKSKEFKDEEYNVGSIEDMSDLDEEVE